MVDTACLLTPSNSVSSKIGSPSLPPPSLGVAEIEINTACGVFFGTRSSSWVKKKLRERYLSVFTETRGVSLIETAQFIIGGIDRARSIVDQKS